MVERHPYTVDMGVQFSNEVPVISGYSTVGSTFACQAKGHRFEPDYPLQR